MGSKHAIGKIKLRNSKMKKLAIATLLFVCFSFTYLVNNKAPFSSKTYGNVANYFANEKDMQDFFDFKKGNAIAEIGAGDGQNIGGFSLFTDSLTFYLEDIDEKYLNQDNFNKVIKRCSKIKSPLTNKFQLSIGTEKSTNLPDNLFDKIVIVSTFHEFSYMDEMVADISKKLKPNGRIYILETHCLAKGHKYYSFEETVSIMKKYDFHLEKKDETNRNESDGLYKAIFDK
jgi:ubiquinone/menaquinone biosynthesis C-methylase UbiE